MSVCFFCPCLLVTLVYSLYASGCLLSALFLIYILCVYLSKKRKIGYESLFKFNQENMILG